MPYVQICLLPEHSDTVSLVNLIVNRHLSMSGCQRMLSSDGITSSVLAIRGIAGVFEGISLDMRSARKQNVSFGECASTAKNLDEYQFRICTYVPLVADTNPSKIQLQKYRIAIISAFAKLSSILVTGKTQSLAEWNSIAKMLLVDASDTYTKASSGAGYQPLQLAQMTPESYHFFGITESQIDSALDRMYGGSGRAADEEGGGE